MSERIDHQSTTTLKCCNQCATGGPAKFSYACEQGHVVHSGKEIMKTYKAISISYANVGETFTYITEDSVTEEQIIAGFDTGVVCQVLDPSHTDTILSALNGQNDTVTSEKNS
jgi:hypothetical protein